MSDHSSWHGANASAFAFAFSAFALSSLGACANAERPAMGEPGVNCWDLNSSLTCDPGSEDLNGDGECTVLDCRGEMGDMGTMGTPGGQGGSGLPGDAGPQGPGGDAGPQGPAGPAGDAGPQGPAGTGSTTGQLGVTVFGTSPITIGANAYLAIPGLNTVQTIPADSVVQISTDGSWVLDSGSTTAFATIDIILGVDGQLLSNGNGGNRRTFAQNSSFVVNTIATWSMTAVVPLAAGSHTFTVYAKWNNGSNGTSAVGAVVGGGTLSPHQPSLSVVVLKK